MNKNILLSAVLCGLCLAPFATVQANDKVETTYNAQKYMQIHAALQRQIPRNLG